MRKRREVVSGIVNRVRPIGKYLTLISVRPIDDSGWAEYTFPFYECVKDPAELVDRPVDLVTTESGWFNRTVTQELSGSNFGHSVTFPKSVIEGIHRAYAHKIKNR